MLVFLGSLPSLYTKLLLTTCLISIRTFPSGKNSTYLCRMGRRYLNFFQILFNNVEIVRQLQCKAGKDQIRIGGRESLGIFYAVGAKGGRISVTSSSEISATAANVFPNARTEGEDFSNTSSVNCLSLIHI